MQLRDKNERLLIKVGHLEGRLTHIASSNTDLSSRLVQSEEGKLRISKELVEDKIQMSKMREQYEEETFELKNKILNQNGIVTELEMQRDKLLGDLLSAEARLKVGEQRGQNLTEENATLKKNYLALAEAHDKEVGQSEELTAELLALARAQDALRRQLEEQHQRVQSNTRDLHGELDRVQTLISHMSHSRVKPEDLAALERVQKNMEKSLLGKQDEIKDMLERMKASYEKQHQRLKERVVAMSKEHQEDRTAIHNSQQKLSEQSAALWCIERQLKEVEEENSKLQLQIKELNEEYRARLVCYVHDIAEYIDSLGEDRVLSLGSKMKTFVDNILQDVRSSYRVREEQLASAARCYKKRLQRVTKTHHALLIAYRVQREQILVKPGSGVDPGPPEAHFSLEVSELKDESERELQQLRQDKARLESQLQATQNKVAAFTTPGQEGEKERGVLISRATVAEAQVSELQDYIDSHLIRYKQEISKLHKLHGIEKATQARSAPSSLS
ncbi:coiled-coil domain-containing protein 78 [Aulostomus maculatus]